MRAVIWKLLVGVCGIASFVLGIRRIPSKPELLEPWLSEMIPEALTWIVPVTLIAIGAFLLALLVADIIFGFRNRRRERRLVDELRRANGSDWRETDAGKVLEYMTNKSKWAWKAYASLNHWFFVDARYACHELRRAAQQDDVRLTGQRPNSSARVKPISSGYWLHAEISSHIGISNGTYAEIMPNHQLLNRETNLYHLHVSTYDYQSEWPPAGMALRIWATAWVALKRIWYWFAEFWEHSCHKWRTKWRTITDNIRANDR